MANVKELKNGDLILVKLDGEECKAKFLKLNSDGTKMNVFVKAKLLWVAPDTFIGMAQPLAIVGKDENTAQEAKVEATAPAPKAKAKGSKKGAQAAENKAESTQAEEPAKTEGAKEASLKSLKLSATQSKVLTAIAQVPDGKEIDILNLAEITGILNPQIRKAAEGLVSAGLITMTDEKETGTKFQITESGEQLNNTPMAKKAAKKPAKKVKAKSSGDANEPSKRDQIVNLLKNKDLSVDDIADKMDTDPNYVREIKASLNKKMDEPEKGTTKREVFDLLKKGKSAKEAAASAKVSTVYVYKIQKQMQAAGVI